MHRRFVVLLSLGTAFIAIALGAYLIRGIASPEESRTVSTSHVAVTNSASGQLSVLPDNQSTENPSLLQTYFAEDAVPLDSISDLDPFHLYNDYIDRAESGDADAAFVLLTALQECKYVIRNEEEYDRKITYRGVDLSVANSSRRDMVRCIPLFDVVPNIEAEHARWYQDVVEAGHPLFLVDQRGQSFDDARQHVVDALSIEYPERHVYRPAFLAASRLYLEYPEHGIDENRFMAWQMLACFVSHRCEHSEMTEMLDSEFSATQVEEILTIESDLRRSLSSGNLSGLQLFAPS